MAARPNMAVSRSACPAVISPAATSSRGSPAWASARSPAVTAATVAWRCGFSASTSMTHPRTEVSRDRSRAESCSSVTLATWASRSARASRPRPVPRSSRGRSSGSTQTSGSTPAGPGEADQVQGDRALGQVEHRDLAARGQPVRAGRGEHRGPAGERAAGDVYAVHPVRRADRVPAFLMLVGDPELLPLPHPGRVLGLPGEEPALLGRPHLPTRARSSASLDRSARSPCQMAYPLTAATSAQQITPSPASRTLISPKTPSANAARPSATAMPKAAFSGRLSRLSSWRWAAAQSGLSRSCSGGVGRRGGGPGAGCGVAY